MVSSGVTRRRWILWAFVAAAVVLCWPLALPWIYDTHDGHYALYNAAQFDLALRDGQVPVRWLPDLFGGRGIPHFVFYHPLVFYLIAALHALGPGFIFSVKAVSIAAAAAAAPAMYAWLRDTLPPSPAAAGALAYALAPMHAVEIHVKGDPPAGLAWSLAPLVLLAAGRAARRTPYGAPALALASAALVLAHSVTAFLVAPFAVGWALVCRDRGHPVRSALQVVAGGLGGAALSMWQWLPALTEKAFVHVESARGILFFDFREHFLAARQWLSPLWGYHGSFAGTHDDMAFQIGPVQAAALLGALLLWRRLAPGGARRLAGFALVTAGLCLLLTLDVARPIWEWVGPMKFVQFPWRWLAPAVRDLDDGLYVELFRAAEELGLDALTEAHDAAELDRALALDAPAIGVNARDLSTFAIDREAQLRLVARAPRDRVVVAESGVESRAQGAAAELAGADAILVGSALMRAPDPAAKLEELLSRPLVKVCGLTRQEDVDAAVEAGADLTGFILARETPRRAPRVLDVPDHVLSVAVYVGETGDDDADLVQLHDRVNGHRSREAALLRDGTEVARLLDLPWEGEDPEHHARAADVAGRIVLAGKLGPDNVAAAVARVRPWAVDASSRLETEPGVKDHAKVRAFVAAARC